MQYDHLEKSSSLSVCVVAERLELAFIIVASRMCSSFGDQTSRCTQSVVSESLQTKIFARNAELGQLRFVDANEIIVRLSSQDERKATRAVTMSTAPSWL
jgi:hypothetical protein